MKTNIQVKKETRKELLKIKAELVHKNLDQTINYLLYTEKDLHRGDKNDQNGTVLMPNSQCSDSFIGEQSSPNTPNYLMEVNGGE